MGEERSLKSTNAPADLSNILRGDIINCIVERLPIRDAAKMSVLSHKWRDAWISTPQLMFDAHFFSTVLKHECCWHCKLYRTVNRILFLHEGPILKFSLYIPSQLTDYPNISEWISFLSRNGLRDFSLQNHYNFYPDLSLHLFSCLNLESLNLRRCQLSPPPNFIGFRKLKNLELVRVIIKEGTFEHFIASSRLLEILYLKHCKGIEHLNIDAPNLKQLTVVGSFKSLNVRNVENVMSATMDLEQPAICSRDLIKALLKSTKLDKLWFGGRFCKVLFSDCLVKPIFDRLRALELSSVLMDDADGFSSAVRAIRSCPNIEKLFISVTSIGDVDKHSLAYDSSCRFLQLRNITVTLQRGWDIELELIEFLLACSPKLEMMYVEINSEVDTYEKSRISLKLRQFHKASPNMTLVICMSSNKGDLSSEDSDTDASSDQEREYSPCFCHSSPRVFSIFRSPYEIYNKMQ